MKIRPKQANASACDSDRCCLQSGDIGDEAAGVVEAVGPNDGVRDLHRFESTVIPDGVTDDQAASSLLKGLTARYLLKDTVQLHEGDTVLYHAAAGGVGQTFTQWASSLGIHVIGTVSTAEKAQIALQAGCTAVVNYSTEDFVERTFELTSGQGVKAVYDSVGKDTFRGSLAVLRPRGTLVQFGKASGFPEPINPFELAPRALYLTWAILPHYNDTPEALGPICACAPILRHRNELSLRGHHDWPLKPVNRKLTASSCPISRRLLPVTGQLGAHLGCW